MNIAIIPARGGSKRIPRKNIKNFHGKPLIAYSIEAAKASQCFNKIIVSTDDREIADIAQAYGAEVPFIRPDDISNDFATTLDVMQHAISWCKEQNWIFENVCCIYATAPFVLPKYILQGLSELQKDNTQYVFSATTFPFAIQRAITLDSHGFMQMISPKHKNTRSQDLPETYHDAGQFYWGKATAFADGKDIFEQHSKMILIPRKRVQDIDTQTGS